VALVVLEGAGLLVVGGEEHTLSAGALAIVPRGARRSMVAGPKGLRCLTVHRRRGGLEVTDFRRNPGVGLRSDTSPDAGRTPQASDSSRTSAAPPTAQDATASSTASGMSKFA
jgi:uncharacterized cupin superfamily protein